MAEEKSLFEKASESELPLEELLASMKEESNNTKPTETKEEKTIKKELSPLEQLALEKEKIGSGIVVSNEDLKNGQDGPKKSFAENDERMANLQKEVDSYDLKMKKRNAVVVLKQPVDEIEYIQLIDEINKVQFDSSDKAYFPKGFKPTYTKLREEGESVFDYSSLKKFEDDIKDEEDPDEISEEKRGIVNVIIDKTGLGSDFAFTEEERLKIKEASTIKVTEVKEVDIKAIRAKRSNKSFQDSIKEFNVRGSRSTICFPASGFRAQMKGLSYGEYSDIAVSMENITFDKYYKRLSIIYNKMTNISTGEFKDFEDFLHHFAYTDIPLAIYAIFIATENENQEISLRCGNDSCKRTFDWSYNTRSVLRLERCSDTFLEKMRELTIADAIEYDVIKERSAVNNSKAIELPDSGIVVEMGIASAYDFLYNFIPLMNEDTFKEAFGENDTETYANNMLLLTTVRKVYIPDGNGEYTEAEGYKDILDSIYTISPREIKIIAAYASKYQTMYDMSFSFENVVCPHCKNVTKHLDIAMDDLFYQTYQTLMSSEVDLSQIQDF